ncbi:hypothetical protein QBC43DRAFT_381200 [Cladorrhinum sp. PSN259]|nr:hypothetical protein QBC43DRAFT_381200 [Cladorrhinum sp. PSN259]
MRFDVLVCEVCKKVDSNLQRCAGCSVYYYCSRDHQAADWSTHKPTCKQISAARKKVEQEKAKADVARLEYGNFLIRSWRRQGIENALKEYLAILEDNRGDHQSARSFIPSLYIRLGQDQEAYDLIKWYQIKFKGVNPNDRKYRWGDPEEPFLGLKDEDVSEDCELFMGKFHQLGHSVNLWIIKFRLLQACIALNTYKTTVYQPDGPVPTKEEILAFVKDKSNCPGNSIDRQPVVELVTGNNGALDEMERNITTQLLTLFNSVKEYNPHIWKILVEPDVRALSANPQPYSHGSRAEADLVFGQTYSAWAESPNALAGLRGWVKDVGQI